MKAFVVLSAVLAIAVARPSIVAPIAYSTGPLIAAPVPIAAASLVQSQFHAQDELGQYTYGYQSPLSAKTEIKTADGVTRGGYTFIDAQGKIQSAEYIADAVNGFRVAASNLPVAPAPPAVPILEAPKPVEDTIEVAKAKAAHLVALKEAEVRASLPEPVAVKTEVVKSEVVAPVVADVAAVPVPAPLLTPTFAAPLTAIHVGSPIAYGYATYSAPGFIAAPWASPLTFGSDIVSIENPVIAKVKKVEEVKPKKE